MALDPLSVMTVGGVLWKVLSDLPRKRRGGIAEPVPFSAVDIEAFTSVERPPSSAGMLHAQGTRRFDADMCKAIVMVLRSRSARQIQASELSLAQFPISAYEIVPPVMGLPSASDVIDHAGRHNLVALGSLSLALLLTGAQVPFILVVGAPGIEQQLAIAGTNPQTGEPASQFARIYPPVSGAVVEAVAEAVAEPEPFPAPPTETKANGVHVAAKSPAVVDATAEAKDG